MSEKVINLTAENFDEVVKNATVPVLVDFWASWCGPCRMVSPLIDQIADEIGDTAKICKVNVDDEGALAVQYNVMNIPTVILFNGGQEKDRAIGAHPKSHYEDLINNADK